ncbi:MAG: alpha/beta hydrolase [Simkaniaceae bacterium]|nr:alpha/beta hydrolase [Simkaniaceae bacterium]
MAFAKIDTVNVYYESTEQRGETILFVPGFTAHRESWRPLAERLASSHGTVLFDNRGSGESDTPEGPYTMEMLARDLLGLMDALDIVDAHFMGASMGTAIIQTVALIAPERVKSSVLIAPFAQLPETTAMHITTVGKLFLAQIPMELIIENSIPWLYGSRVTGNRDAVAKLIENRMNDPLSHNLTGFFGQCAALKEYDIRDRLGEIRHPVLLIAGEEDLTTPLICARYLHDRLPNATLRTIPRVGHMVYDEQPEKVYREVVGFIPPPVP